MSDRIDSGGEAANTLFIGRWTVEIINTLRERPHRHGELRRRLRSISQRMLTRTLRNLEASGLISRHVIRAKPVAVEYALTRLGKTFVVPLGAICRWVQRNGGGINANIRISGE
jgi:DNA-binding HxlR family transcriptional regulator